MSELRLASRASGGVRGIKLAKKAQVVSLEIASAGEQLLTVSERGSGKRTPIEDYPLHHRGGSGVITFKVIEKTGPVAAARMVHDTQELIVISREGIVLRTRMEGIAVQGRSTQGVAVINLGPGDAVASVEVIEMAQPQGVATAEGPAPSDPPAQMPLPTGGKASGNGRRTGGAPAGGNGKGASKTKRPDTRAALSRADAAIRKAKAVNAKARARKPAPKPRRPARR